MTTMDSNLDDMAPTPRSRRRGAPKGNRNAWKHGQRSAAAQVAREAARRGVIDRLPDPNLFVRLGANHQPEIQYLGWEAALPQFRSNKTNNSVARADKGEGTPPPIFSTNKTNNSVAPESPRKRGAPKGNKNALKHGFRSDKRHEFDAELRTFIRRMNAMCKLANVMANVRRSG
jgi:uncharacterized protein YjcR